MTDKSAFAALGGRVRARRKAIGMTQAELASAIGVSFQQVQKYEKGISAISPLRLQQICEVMKLPVKFFTAEDGDGRDGAAPGPAMDGDGDAVAHFLTTGEGRRLVDSFMRIRDPKLRTRILDFIAAVGNDRPAG